MGSGIESICAKSRWQNSNGNWYSPYANDWNGKRNLNLNWRENDWNGSYRFLARKIFIFSDSFGVFKYFKPFANHFSDF